MLEDRERFLLMDASRPGFQGLRLVLAYSPHRGPNCETDLSKVFDESRSKENLRAKFPKDRKPCASNYDYENYSDLEDDGDGDTSDSEDGPAFPVPQVAAEK